jgi:hypothetical protein
MGRETTLPRGRAVEETYLNLPLMLPTTMILEA